MQMNTFENFYFDTCCWDSKKAPNKYLDKIDQFYSGWVQPETSRNL